MIWKLKTKKLGEELFKLLIWDDNDECWDNICSSCNSSDSCAFNWRNLPQTSRGSVFVTIKNFVVRECYSCIIDDKSNFTNNLQIIYW